MAPLMHNKDSQSEAPGALLVIYKSVITRWLGLQIIGKKGKKECWQDELFSESLQLEGSWKIPP